MRAAYIEEHGEPDDVIQFGDVETPEPAAGQVRVRVDATALNHLDLWLLRGLPGLPPSFPHVSGCDVAGVIDTLGPDVPGEWQEGERVLVNPSISCGTCEWCLRGQDNFCENFGIMGEHLWGGMAEYVVVPARNLYRIPDALSFEEAAALPLVFATAWRMLITQAEIKPGELVLVMGAGGGVNSAAIQVAKAAGCTVWATTSTPDKMEKARELGADWIINYNEDGWSKRIWTETDKRGVDVVVDNVGEATWTNSLRLLGRGGRLVTVGATTGPHAETDIRYIFWRQLKIIGSTMSTTGEFMDMMRLVRNGLLKPVVDRVLPLEKIVEALKILERGDQFGKIVIRVGA